MLGITFRASENRMWITSYLSLRYENKAISVLRILPQTEVPQNAKCLYEKQKRRMMLL